MNIIENKDRLVSLFGDIKQSIEQKGVSVTDNISTYPNAIESIPSSSPDVDKIKVQIAASGQYSGSTEMGYFPMERYYDVNGVRCFETQNTKTVCLVGGSYLIIINAICYYRSATTVSVLNRLYFKNSTLLDCTSLDYQSALFQSKQEINTGDSIQIYRSMSGGGTIVEMGNVYIYKIYESA